MAEGYSGAAIDSADVAAGHTNYGRFNGDVGDAFGFFYGTANRADRGVQVDDETFAKTLGFRGTQREKPNLFIIHLRDERGGFHAADVQPDEIFVFLCQACSRPIWPSPYWFLR